MASDAGLGAPESARRVDTVRTYLEPIAAVQAMFGVAAALALFVAALGIVNVGLSSIRERARELVIRRAIGATRDQVFRLVISSSILLAVIVATASIAVSVLLVALVPRLLPPDSPVTVPAYPLPAAVWALVVSVLTAVVSSAFPAWRAARVEPAVALRE
ncbi:FtsX-like permease family protein [Clavibacter nebraskensis]